MGKYIKLITIFSIASALLACIFYINNSDKKYIAKQLNVKIPEVLNIEYQDHHGGFHGDGEAFGKVSFNEINGDSFASQVANSHSWNKLPITENLNLLLYGGEKNNVEYTDNFAQKLGIPQINNGYWFFLDRHPESHSSHSDANILSRSSLNFTFALFDVDTKTLYFEEFDT